MIEVMRLFPFAMIVFGFVVLVALGVVTANPFFLVVGGLFGLLVVLGIYDLAQKRNNILRNYPVVGHMWFLLLELRPEMRQYFIEGDTDGHPFTWDERQLVYDRAEGKEGLAAFGTELDVYRPGYLWFDHSIGAKAVHKTDFRVLIGGPDCLQPYSSSLLNISAMSFGSLSSAAILAMGRGAAKGKFGHCTGEGGVSRYHLEGGADVIYQLGTGYFGCRGADGGFDAERFKKTAGHEQVKMVEIKISQGAKPGHGGVLPGRKVTAEIAEARGVVIGTDCLSPPGIRHFRHRGGCVSL